MDAFPPVGSVRLGDLAAVRPVSRDCARDRGTPIDEYYTARFLGHHIPELRGTLLVVGSPPGASGLPEIGRLEAASDLDSAARLEPGVYGAVACCGALEKAEDPLAAVGLLHRLLRPGGVLLAVLDGMGARPNRTGDLWSFTTAAADRLFGEHFPDVRVSSSGNVRSAVACLQGIAAEELPEKVLASNDPDYPVVVAVRAAKGEGAAG